MRDSVFLLLAILAVALNLRPAMAGLGPLLDLIQQGTGLGAARAGLLTALPVFLMGLGAFAGLALRRSLGPRRGVATGIAAISVGTAGRLIWHDQAGMFATAACVGLGIAVVQALIPGTVKESFGVQTGRVMGLYTTGMMAGAAIAAATAAGLAQAVGWTGALAIWAGPAALALAIWLACPTAAPSSAGTSDSVPILLGSSGRAWLLMLFFGIGTGAYTLVLAWLPPYYMGLGQSREVGGYLLAGLTLTEVVAGLTISVVIGRFPDRRLPILAVLGCILTGLVMLVQDPTGLALPTVILLGLGIGGLFPLSLIVTMDHADDPAQAGALAAFVQGGGYMIASAMPVVAGMVKDRFNDLSGAWLLMAAAVAMLVAMAMRFTPQSRITG